MRTVAFIAGAGLLALVGLGHHGAEPVDHGREAGCGWYVRDHQPRGSFVVYSTAPDASGKSLWLLDTEGRRLLVACTETAEGRVTKVAAAPYNR